MVQAELRAADGDPATARQLLDRALAIFDGLGTLDGPDRARRLLATSTRLGRRSRIADAGRRVMRSPGVVARAERALGFARALRLGDAPGR